MALHSLEAPCLGKSIKMREVGQRHQELCRRNGEGIHGDVENMSFMPVALVYTIQSVCMPEFHRPDPYLVVLLVQRKRGIWSQVTA